MKLKIVLISMALLLSTNTMARAPELKATPAPYFDLELDIIPPPGNYANGKPFYLGFDVTVFNGQWTMVKNRLPEHVADLKVCGHQEPDGRFVVVTHFELKHRDIAMNQFTFSDVRLLAKKELKYVEMKNQASGEPIAGSATYLIP